MIDKNNIPEGYELGKTIDEHGVEQDCYVQINNIILSNEEIGANITQEVYDGNPYAQIADLAKAQVTTLALLVPILGKEVVAGAYADLIVTVKKVSESRVKQGLSPYDLSFLE